jgi:hypothetical protein
MHIGKTIAQLRNLPQQFMQRGRQNTWIFASFPTQSELEKNSRKYSVISLKNLRHHVGKKESEIHCKFCENFATTSSEKESRKQLSRHHVGKFHSYHQTSHRIISTPISRTVNLDNKQIQDQISIRPLYEASCFWYKDTSNPATSYSSNLSSIAIASIALHMNPTPKPTPDSANFKK